MKINQLGKYEFDAFTGTFLACSQDDSIICQYHEKSHEKTIRPLIDYLLELPVLDECEIKTARAINGYAHGLHFVDPITSAKLLNINYGGKNQNGTISARLSGSCTNSMLPMLARHFQFRTTRIDSALNYQGAYNAIQAVLCQVTDTPDPKHLGNNEGGHTNYFGSRTSPTMIRHYQYGKHHFPNFPEWHDENRIEVEWKPKDRLHQEKAQTLTAEQVFARSLAGRKIQEYMHGKSAKVSLVSSRRTIQTDMLEKLRTIAITYRATFESSLAIFGGDYEQLAMTIHNIIIEHEKRARQ